MYVMESTLDTTLKHCETLIKQKQALLDGLNRLANILQGPANVTKQELMTIISTTLWDSALIE